MEGHPLDLAGTLAPADRITLTTNLNQRLATVDERDRIEEVVAWLGGVGEGWSVPARGVVVTRLRVNFSRGEVPLGNVGVDDDVLTAHHRGAFFQRDSTPDVRARLFAALGIADPGL